IIEQVGGQLIYVERDFGDDRPVDAGQVRGDERGFTRVAPEQLDDGDPLVRAGAGPQVVDKVHAARHGGAEPDAVIRPEDVVIHRLGDGQHVYALAVQPLGIAERVVAADGDNHVQPHRLDDLQHVPGEVVPGRILCRPVLILQELRDIL